MRCGPVRSSTVPYRAVPYRTVPYRTMQCCSIVPCLTRSCFSSQRAVETWWIWCSSWMALGASATLIRSSFMERTWRATTGTSSLRLWRTSWATSRSDSRTHESGWSRSLRLLKLSGACSRESPIYKHQGISRLRNDSCEQDVFCITYVIVDASLMQVRCKWRLKWRNVMQNYTTFGI